MRLRTILLITVIAIIFACTSSYLGHPATNFMIENQAWNRATVYVDCGSANIRIGAVEANQTLHEERRLPPCGTFDIILDFLAESRDHRFGPIQASEGDIVEFTITNYVPASYWRVHE